MQNTFSKFHFPPLTSENIFTHTIYCSGVLRGLLYAKYVLPYNTTTMVISTPKNHENHYYNYDK